MTSTQKWPVTPGTVTTFLFKGLVPECWEVADARKTRKGDRVVVRPVEPLEPFGIHEVVILTPPSELADAHRRIEELEALVGELRGRINGEAV